MAKQYAEITQEIQDFIEQQKIFFVATAPSVTVPDASEGRVNVSPKGMDTLRVRDARTVTWLNLTGSGNETAAHVLENSRMTLMFCAFSGDPMILRLYGRARVIHPRDGEWCAMLALFPTIAGARQIFHMDVDLVQTSCGMSVPFFTYEGERTQLQKWAENKGPEGIADYWREKNQTSLDGQPTGVLPKG